MTSKTDTRRTGAAGFVLFELVLVLILMAIITATIIPLYGSSMGEIQRRSTRNQLVSILLHIQERAVSESLEYRFYLDDYTNEYWVERQVVTPPEVIEKVFEEVLEEYGRPARLPLYFEFDDVKEARSDSERKANFISCFPSGVCDPVRFSVADIRTRETQFTIETLGTLGQIRTETPKR